jgi:hypothetical protein
MTSPTYIVDGVLTEGEPWVFLESFAGDGSTTSVTWSSGTGTKNWSQYEALYLVFQGRAAGSSSQMHIRFNGDSGLDNYRYTYTSGDNGYVSGGSANESTSTEIGRFAASSSTALYTGGGHMTIHNPGTGAFKNTQSQYGWTYSNTAYGGVQNMSTTWRGQGAITSILLQMGSGSTAMLATGSYIGMWGLLPRMVNP